MKPIILHVLVFLISICGFSQSSWNLKKDKNDIQIYTRDYPDSKFKEYKANMLVKTSLETVKNIILDGDNLKNWNFKTTQSKLLKKVNEDSYIVYMYNDMPWPVLNRDHISNVKVSYPSTSSILISITPNNDFLPLEDNIVRITNFKGFWLLEETPEGISITQQLFGDPGGGIPSWLVNSQVVKAPYTSFGNLKSLLKNKQK